MFCVTAATALCFAKFKLIHQVPFEELELQKWGDERTGLTGIWEAVDVGIVCQTPGKGCWRTRDP